MWIKGRIVEGTGKFVKIGDSEEHILEGEERVFWSRRQKAIRLLYKTLRTLYASVYYYFFPFFAIGITYYADRWT